MERRVAVPVSRIEILAQLLYEKSNSFERAALWNMRLARHATEPGSGDERGHVLIGRE